jgi:hypothetical protein
MSASSREPEGDRNLLATASPKDIPKPEKTENQIHPRPNPSKTIFVIPLSTSTTTSTSGNSKTTTCKGRMGVPDSINLFNTNSEKGGALSSLDISNNAVIANHRSY